MSEVCHECIGCTELKARVDRNERFYMPIANQATSLMSSIPAELSDLNNRIRTLETNAAVETEGIKSIIQRMDKHDIMEENKRVERNADRRANRVAALTLILAVGGVALSFMIWLNDFNKETSERAHRDEIKFENIERALGIYIENK